MATVLGHALGNALGRRLGDDLSASLFAQLLILSASRPVFTASGHITLSGTGDVLSIHDWNDDTHVLTQADTAKQCDPPAAHADFNGQACLSTTGVQWYASNRAAADWSFGNDGLGFSSVHVHTPTAAGAGLICATGTAAGIVGGSSRGFSITYISTTQPTSFRVASGAANVFNATPTTAATQNVPTYAQTYYLEDAPTPEYTIYRKGSLTGSGDSLAEPSASAPAASLRLFADSAGAFPITCRWRSSVFASKVFSASERTNVVQQWIQQDTGIAP